MAHGHADISKHVKLYLGVFLALAIGTVITVAANHIHFQEHAVAIGIALLIASVKASLVAAVFMHLKWEKSIWIWTTLAFCGVFFIVLLFIPVLTTNDLPPQVKMGTWDVPAHVAEADEGHKTGH